MKYDDASWHYGGDFPSELPESSGAIHSGLFLAWAILRGLGSEVHTTEYPDGLAKLQSRTITPAQFLIVHCDEKFMDSDLGEEGNLFASEYFDLEHGQYLEDYDACLGGDLPSLYHVPDSWESFDLLEPLLERRFNEWRSRRK